MPSENKYKSELYMFQAAEVMKRGIHTPWKYSRFQQNPVQIP